MKKKILLLTSTIMLLTLLFCGCSEKEIKEATIVDDLNEYQKLNYNTFFDWSNTQSDTTLETILDIKQEMTDTTDTAYIVAKYSDDYFDSTMYLKAVYEYYNNSGWTLKSVEHTDSSVLVPKNADSLNLDNSSLVGDLYEYYDKCTLTDTSFDDENLTCQVVYTVEKTTDTGHISGDVTMDFKFEKNSWSYSDTIDNTAVAWNINGEWVGNIELHTDVVLNILDFDENSISYTLSQEVYNDGTLEYSNPTKNYDNITIDKVEEVNLSETAKTELSKISPIYRLSLTLDYPFLNKAGQPKGEATKGYVYIGKNGIAYLSDDIMLYRLERY